MNPMIDKTKKRGSLIVLAVCLFTVSASSQDLAGPKFNASGELQLPANYREWVFLSAGIGMTYDVSKTTNPNPPFQNVFVSRAAYNGFLRNGLWPDKTMFVLEIRTSESKGSINVAGRYQTGIIGREAEVKQGGQWSFYGFGADGKTAKARPRTQDCYACHAAHTAVDNTFVQFYPTLIPIAKAKGTYKDAAAGN